MRKVQLSRAAQLDLANAALKRRAAASAAGGVPLAVAAGGSVPSLPIQLPAVVARRAPPKALKSSGFNSFWGEGKRGWRAELVSPKLRVAVTAELFGTFLFVATGLFSVMSTSQVMGGTGAAALDLVSDAAASTFSAPLAAPYTGAAEVTVVGPDVGPGTDILWVGAGVTQIIARQMAISLVFGFMICVLVFATGAISGGNINPAVTLSLFLQGKMSVLRMVLYVLAQCGGAIMGAFYARSLSPSIFVSVEGGRNDLSDRVKNDWGGNLFWSTLGAEICGTALLVFTVSAAADAGREQAFKYVGALTPLMIGFAVLVTHVALIPIDGCSINPARSLGSAVAINIWEDHWLFWLGPLLGGPLAAFLYDMFFYTGVADADSSVFKNIVKRVKAWREASKASATSAAVAAKNVAAKVQEEEDEDEEEEDGEKEEVVVPISAFAVVPPLSGAAFAQRGKVDALSPSQQSARLAQLGAVAVTAGAALGAPPGAFATQRGSPPPPTPSPLSPPTMSPPGSIHAMLAAQGSPFLSLVKRGSSPSSSPKDFR